MAYDPGALEAALAAAVGEEPVLIAELRDAFFSSAAAIVATLRSAETAEEWTHAAQRLKGLAASFGALRIMDVAQGALDLRAGDAGALARIDRALDALAQAAA